MSIKKIGSITECCQNDCNIFESIDTNISIGHTRWATHGRVTVNNSHPHISSDGCFALVHNGIIENYNLLKEELEHESICFASETDSEVIVNLIAKYYSECNDINAAIIRTNERLIGSFTYLLVTIYDLKHIYGCCYKGTLGYQIVEGMTVIASDQIAIAPYSDDAIFFEDGDIFKASNTEVECFSTRENKEVTRETIKIPKASLCEKNEYSNYMIKEINETPRAINVCNKNIDKKVLMEIAEDIHEKKLCIVGAGSSFFVAQLGQYIFSSLANKDSKVHSADEFLNIYKPTQLNHLIALSQSGETFDTLDVLKKFSEKGAKITSINNVNGSASQRLSQFPILQDCGPELSVLSTKSVSIQVIIIYKIAITLGLINGSLKQEEYNKYMEDSIILESVVSEFIQNKSEEIRKIAERQKEIKNCFFIGNGLNYPVAMESSLKFKEVTYYHSEGISSGSLKHGSLSLIDRSFYTIAFLPNKDAEEKMFYHIMTNISEIQARGGDVIAFGSDDSKMAEFNNLSAYIKIMPVNKYLDSVLFLVAGQLYAYHTAAILKRDIDKPRSLAKAITVS